MTTFHTLWAHGNIAENARTMYLKWETKQVKNGTIENQSRILNGYTDYSFWYGDSSKSATSNLLVVEANRFGEGGSGVAQLLAYMTIVHTARRETKKENTMVYGILSDRFVVHFYCLRDGGRYSVNTLR
ncbi:hypothetical protein BDW59DRAFT_165347 [Aspergillus cavernicola]|uniref:Uncharacterized protein n=1 Tax=Aspergillus cavernicola TaxID=176166 RepID=A0ABR4HTJ1_9EURO